MIRPDRPELVDHALVEAFNSKDLDTAVALHEADCVTWALPHEGGHRQTGHQAIREGFANGLFGIDGHMSLVVRHVTRNGAIALTRSSWEVDGKLPDGTPVRIANSGIEVVRLQEDGTWKFMIDHPWGANPHQFDRFAAPMMQGEL